MQFKSHEKTGMEHRPYHGIAFALNGSLIYRHNSKDIKLCGNTIVYLPKDATYDVICERGGSFALINFQSANNLDINAFVSTTVNSTESLQKEFLNMLRSYSSTSVKTSHQNLSSFYKILSILSSADSKKELPQTLNKAITYIESNISSHTLSNIEIAKEIGISEVYLRKLFANNLSIPPNKYIQSLRLEKAKLMLVETSLSVTEISESCGYSCIYYFCSSFKKNTGYTPSEYRNKNSQDLF